MKIIVHIDRQITGIKFSADRLKRLVRVVCNRFKVYDAAINIKIVGDFQIRRLNKEFLNCSCNTDCLSFDLSEGQGGSQRLFDFVVNGQMAVRQAEMRGHSQEAELALYIVHCLLHNLGYSDKSRRRAQEMHVIEDEILQQHGYGLVYKGFPKRKRMRLGAPNKPGR
jgi:probable rRNA maturation factor